MLLNWEGFAPEKISTSPYSFFFARVYFFPHKHCACGWLRLKLTLGTNEREEEEKRNGKKEKKLDDQSSESSLAPSPSWHTRNIRACQ